MADEYLKTLAALRELKKDLDRLEQQYKESYDISERRWESHTRDTATITTIVSNLDEHFKVLNKVLLIGNGQPSLMQQLSANNQKLKDYAKRIEILENNQNRVKKYISVPLNEEEEIDFKKQKFKKRLTGIGALVAAAVPGIWAVLEKWLQSP